MAIILALIPVLQGLFIIQLWSSISYFSISLIGSTFLLLCYMALSKGDTQLNYKCIILKILIAIIVAYLILVYNNPLLSLVILFTFPFLLVNWQFIKFEIIDDIFFILALVSFLFYFLALIGLVEGIQVKIGDREYYYYIFTLSDFDIAKSTNLQSIRFYGFSDEPGRMGLYLGFSLFLRKDISYYRSIVVVVLGISTLSTIFFYFLFLFIIYHYYHIQRTNILLRISALIFFIGAYLFLDSILLYYNNAELYKFLLYKIDFLSFINLERRLNTEAFFELFSQFSTSEHIIGSNQIIDDDSSLLSLYIKMGMIAVLAYLILLLYFRRIWYILVPLAFVRYNFIFSEYIYIAALYIYIKNIKNKSTVASQL